MSEAFFDLFDRSYTKEQFIKFLSILNDDSLYFEFIPAIKCKQPLYQTSDFSPNAQHLYIIYNPSKNLKWHCEINASSYVISGWINVHLCFVHIRVLTFIIKRGFWNTFQIVEYIFNLLGSLLIIDQIQAWDICHCPPDKILRVGGERGTFSILQDQREERGTDKWPR